MSTVLLCQESLDWVGVQTPKGVWHCQQALWGEGFPGGSVVKNLPTSAGVTGDVGSIPGLGIPGGGNGSIPRIPSNSCLKNPMDRRAWQVTAHGVAESWTRLSIHTCCGEGLAVTLGAHEVGPHSIQTQKFIYVKPCSLAITL